VTAAALGVAVTGLAVTHLDSPDLLARGLAHSLGMTLFLLLLWLGWRARRGGASAVFWPLWLFCLLVNARFVLLASFCPTALAPAMALAIDSFRRARVQPPLRSIQAFALLVVAFSIWMQIRFFHLAGGVVEIETTLGRIATTTRQAEIIRPIQDEVRGLPPGPLFVAGWAPGWYLVTGRANDTRFDLLLPGLGTTPPEALELARELARSPPSVLLVDGSLEPSEQAVVEALFPGLEAHYTPIDTPEPSLWKVYSRRAPRSSDALAR
jgi:hypothetical protein